MKANKLKRRAIWYVLCTVLFSAVVFAGPAAGGAKPRPAPVSPVSVDGEAPTLDVRSIVRRVDI